MFGRTDTLMVFHLAGHTCSQRGQDGKRKELMLPTQCICP